MASLGENLLKTDSIYNDFYKKNINENNYKGLNYNNKDVLDQEISKLESQYKEIINKYNYLTEKRKLLD